MQGRMDAGYVRKERRVKGARRNVYTSGKRNKKAKQMPAAC